MHCDLETSIPDWLIEHPEAAAVFKRFRLDASCAGKSLKYVCQHAGLSPPEVLEALQKAIARARLERTSNLHLPTLPRRLTRRAFPAYAYVPGLHPHPRSDKRGHSHGRLAEELIPDDIDGARELYGWGIDLFNHGYYWESHEAWESLWLAAPRQGPRAMFLKALIKLAAAGVKAREGRLQGVQRHARRAGELFGQCAEGGQFQSDAVFGLSSEQLRCDSLAIADRATAIIDAAIPGDAFRPPRRVLPLALEPTSFSLEEARG